MPKPMIVAGIDVGAISTKAVLVSTDRLLASTVSATGADGPGAAAACLCAALKMAGIARRDLRALSATGYGRNAVPFAGAVFTEITCHAKGASFLFPGTETVIDIGGQDCKIISVRGGAVRDFVMNDRCAAGTGRFLEIMAQALETPLTAMGRESLRARRDGAGNVRISHTCTVFAESEVVSMLARRTPKREIILALHDAVAERILGMAHRFPLGRRITLAGGVAKNKGVVDSLQRKLGLTLNVPDDPQIVGALGAALLARG
jgi:predicted CoA-substrate-specific enzyme activase